MNEGRMIEPTDQPDDFEFDAEFPEWARKIALRDKPTSSSVRPDIA
jgi:hypothetical protein